jgi:hypothetical protein
LYIFVHSNTRAAPRANPKHEPNRIETRAEAKIKCLKNLDLTGLYSGAKSHPNLMRASAANAINVTSHLMMVVAAYARRGWINPKNRSREQEETD